MSCNNCGIVVDGNKIDYYPEYNNEEDMDPHPNNIWEDLAQMKTWNCPHCKSDNASEEVWD